MSSSGTIDRDLVNIDENGNERWRVSFTDGWPMMPTTDGNLVVVVLVNDWFLGDAGTGDGGNPGGGMGGGMGGMKGLGTKDGDTGDNVVVVGLDVATGTERWRSTFTGDMGSMVQFAPDGSQIYLTLMDMDGDQEGLIIRASVTSTAGAILTYLTDVNNTTNDSSYQAGFRFAF